MQGAQILRNEAYMVVRYNDERCGATQQNDFLQSRLSIFIEMRKLHRKSTPPLRRRSQ